MFGTDFPTKMAVTIEVVVSFIFPLRAGHPNNYFATLL